MAQAILGSTTIIADRCHVQLIGLLAKFCALNQHQSNQLVPLERVNRELKRRSAVVGIFPNRPAVIRLLGSLLVEPNDELLVGRHCFSKASMRKIADRQAEATVAVAVA